MEGRFRILVTAFDPFGGEMTNASLQCLEALSHEKAEVIKLVVPTSFERSVEVAANAIINEKPDGVIMLGQAAGRPVVTVERVAVNLDDASIADNDENKPVDTPIDANSPTAYFSTLNVKNTVKRIHSCGVPASVSNSAGTFVCNHLMYSVLHLLGGISPQTPAGFIHLPVTPMQAKGNTPSMSTDTCVKAVKAAIDEIIISLGGNIDG